MTNHEAHDNHLAACFLNNLSLLTVELDSKAVMITWDTPSQLTSQILTTYVYDWEGKAPHHVKHMRKCVPFCTWKQAIYCQVNIVIILEIISMFVAMWWSCYISDGCWGWFPLHTLPTIICPGNILGTWIGVPVYMKSIWSRWEYPCKARVTAFKMVKYISVGVTTSKNRWLQK